MGKIRKKFQKNEAKLRPVAAYVPLKEDQIDFGRLEKAANTGSSEVQYLLRTQFSFKMVCRVCSTEFTTLPQIVTHKRKQCRMRMDTAGEEAIAEALLEIIDDQEKRDELLTLMQKPPRSKNTRDVVAASEKIDKQMLRKIPDSTRIVNGKQLCPSPRKQDLYRKDKLEAEKREISTVVMPKEPKEIEMEDFNLRVKKKEINSRIFEEAELPIMNRLSMHPSAVKFADLAAKKCMDKKCANEQEFIDLESLAYHITACHSLPHNVYQCLVCGIVFLEYTSLREHVGEEHSVILWRHKAHREAQVKTRKRKIDEPTPKNEMEFDPEEPTEKQRRIRRAFCRKSIQPQKVDESEEDEENEEDQRERKLLDKFSYRESMVRLVPQSIDVGLLEELEKASTSTTLPVHTWNVSRMVARKHLDFQKDAFENAIGWMIKTPKMRITRGNVQRGKAMPPPTVKPSPNQSAPAKILRETRSISRQSVKEVKVEPKEEIEQINTTDPRFELKLKISRKNFEIVPKKPRSQERGKVNGKRVLEDEEIVADIVDNLVKRVVRKEYKDSYKALFAKKKSTPEDPIETNRPQRVRQANTRYVDGKDFVVPATFRRGRGSANNTSKITPVKASPRKKAIEVKEESDENEEMETPELDGPFLDEGLDEDESLQEFKEDHELDDESIVKDVLESIVEKVAREQSVEEEEPMSTQRAKRSRKLPNWMEDEMLDIGQKYKPRTASSSESQSPKPTKRARKTKTPASKKLQTKRKYRKTQEKLGDSVVLPVTNGDETSNSFQIPMTPDSPFDSPGSSRRKQMLQGITDDSEAKILQVSQKNARGKVVEDMSLVPVYLTPYQRAQIFSHLVPIGMESDPNGPHRCKDCGAEFKNHKEGRRHVVSHVRVIRIRCTLCKVGSFFISDMRNHIMFKHCQRLDKTPAGAVDQSGRLPCMSQTAADSFIEFVDQANHGHVSYTSGKIISIISLKPYLPNARIEESILGPTRFSEHPLVIPDGVDPEIAANQGVLIPCPQEPESLPATRSTGSPAPLPSPLARRSILGKNGSPCPSVLASPPTRLAPILLPAAPLIDPSRPEFKRFPRLKDGDYLDVAETVEIVDVSE